MYELVPPTSKIIEYESPYLKGNKSPKFKLKVFNFEEHETYRSLMLKYANVDDKGKLVKDGNGSCLKNKDGYYVDIFKLGVESITNLIGEKFYPSWDVIKDVVDEISRINSVTELEK